MRRPKFPVIAPEGVPFVFAIAAVGAVFFWYSRWEWLIPAVLLLVIAVRLFRDPVRQIPSAPLGVVSPIDGSILELTEAEESTGTHVLRLQISRLGTYVARAPVEGKIGDARTFSETQAFAPNTLGLQTDEGDKVVLEFREIRVGLPPRFLKSRGERFGQGQRCAYLRLARHAVLYLPGGSQLLVAEGDQLVAGETLLANLPSP